MQAVDPFTEARDPLARARLGVGLATIGINVVAVAALTRLPWSDRRTAVGLNVIDTALRFMAWRRDALLGD